MIRLNLLPDVKIEYLKTKRAHAQVIGVASIVTMAAIGLVVLLAIWVYGGQDFLKKDLTEKLQKNAATLKAKPEIDKYLTLQNQLANLTALHESKSDFSRLLQFLPSITPEGVKFSGIELTADEELGYTLVFQGETKDYTGLATLRDTLVNAMLAPEGVDVKDGEKLFETVTVATSSIGSSTNGGSVVSFRIETAYNPNAFLASIKNPTVSVPTLTTTQSAQSSPDVFGRSSVEENN